MHNNVVENVIATIIFVALSTAVGFILRALGFSTQASINAAVFALLGLAVLFLVGRKFYPRLKRALTVKLLKQVLNVSSNSVDEVTFRNQIVNRVLLANPRVETRGSDSILEFPNQKACESRIRDACAKAKKIKILTIRGEKYFQGARSILRDLCLEKRGRGFSIEVLVLSPEAQHITEDLAEDLGHSSAERTRKRMRNVLDNLKHMEEENENFLVVSPFSFLTGVVHSTQTEEVRDESKALSQRNGAYRGPTVCATREGQCAHPYAGLGLTETG